MIDFIKIGEQFLKIIAVSLTLTSLVAVLGVLIAWFRRDFKVFEGIAEIIIKGIKRIINGNRRR